MNENPVLDTLLARPERFFQQRADRLSAVRGFLLLSGLALLSTAIVGVFLRTLSNRMTGTTMVDNPDRPSKGFCENSATDMLTVDVGCDEPEQVPVELGDLFWEAAAQTLPFVFVGIVVFVALLALLLHVFAGGFEGEGTVGDTVEIVAWSFAVDVVVIALNVGLLVLALDQVDLAVSDPNAVQRQIQRVTRTASGTATTAIQAIGLVCQVGIWTAGMHVVHDVPRARVLVTGGVLAGVLLLLSP